MTLAQARRAAVQSGRWLLYDAQGQLWVGDPGGSPLRYDDPLTARLAAVAVAEATGWPPARIQVREAR